MATAAAAVAARARREVENRFLDNNAFSPERAIDFDPKAPIQRRYLERLIAQGVVHELEPGRYWFDLEAYNEMRRQQFVWGMRIMGLGAIVIVIVFVVQLALKS